VKHKDVLSDKSRKTGTLVRTFKRPNARLPSFKWTNWKISGNDEFPRPVIFSRPG
jgi:hypothetical protein